MRPYEFGDVVDLVIDYYPRVFLVVVFCDFLPRAPKTSAIPISLQRVAGTSRCDGAGISLPRMKINIHHSFDVHMRELGTDTGVRHATVVSHLV